jgi:citrate lyase subunit beta/citryl-CoA lyase
VIRSLLFVPANRDDLVRKVPRFPADAVVIDLEDATAEADKAGARERLAANVAFLREAAIEARLFVRVNALATAHFAHDLAAANACAIDGLVVPKLETVEQKRTLYAATRLRVLYGIETIAGVLNIGELAQHDDRLIGFYFGAEDLAVEMGLERTAEGTEVLYARSRVVLAAKGARVMAIDQAVVAIRDDEQFRRDAQQGRGLGYDGKICLTPNQAELANGAFAPSAAQVERARRLIAAFEAAKAEGRATLDFEGSFVDAPLVKRAEALLELAERAQRGKPH